jgi:hypothetical protein
MLGLSVGLLVLIICAQSEFYFAEQKLIVGSPHTPLALRSDYIKNLSLSTIELSRLSDVPFIQITPVMYSMPPTPGLLSVFRDSLDFMISNVTDASQFYAIFSVYAPLLRNWYNFPDGKVSYNPEQSTYFLSQFLPPFMQATSTGRFHVEHKNFSLPDVPMSLSAGKLVITEQTAILTANCWGTVYEYLKFVTQKQYSVLDTHFTLAVSDSKVALEFFTNSSMFTLLKTTYQSSKEDIFGERTVRNEDLQPGDFVLIWHQNRDGVYLDHAAVFIDEDLYFERAGTGDFVPFRLNDWAGITSSWIPGVFEYEFRRLNDNVDEISNIGDAFGLLNPTTLSLCPELSSLDKVIAQHFCLTPEYDNNNTISTQAYTWVERIPLVQSSEGKWTVSSSTVEQ